MEGIEKGVIAKADLVKALKDAVTYCGKIQDGLTDAKAADLTPSFDRKMARVSILDFNTAHNYDHYGNLVTYMRLKGSSLPPARRRRRS